jgi:hypothetical protein
MQTVVYDEINSNDMKKLDGLTGEYNFGSVKGRDRHMAIWLTNMACIWEEEQEIEDGRVVMAAWDADNAYPSLFQDGVDWLMWKKGVRGAIWQAARNMDRKLKGKIRVNGHFIEMKVHEEGASQGAVSPPHRWKYMMGQWFRRCVKKNIGVQIGNRRVPGVGFVDDITMNAYTVDAVKRLVHERQEYGDKWGVEWKAAKDGYLVRGKRKGMKEMEKQLLAEGLKVKKEVKLLGEWMGPDPSRCARQVKETIKAMKKAAKALEWMVWQGSVVDSQTVEGLFETMVGSVAESHLIHTRIRHSEWINIERVKSAVGKKFARIHKRASRQGIMAELGWTTVQGRVWKAKLGVYRRLTVGPQLIRQVLETSRILAAKHETEGKQVGLIGEIKEIMEQLGIGQYWGKEQLPTKAKWKDITTDAVRGWEKQEWRTWKASQALRQKWPAGLASGWDTNDSLNMNTKDRQLLLGIKMMVTREDRGIQKQHTGECGVCGEKTTRGAYHLVTECMRWEGIRVTALGMEHQDSTGRQTWKQMTTGEDRAMHYLREVSRLYEKETGVKLMPWVGNLGTRTEEGATGMSVLVKQVSKWIERREE